MGQFWALWKVGLKALGSRLDVGLEAKKMEVRAPARVLKAWALEEELGGPRLKQEEQICKGG